ncbi:MAG TPA: type II toxin-antitoxin system VapC family toxin [Armatimonadota bacterium]|nr:type II toxin-antitoxin system VapC family toxin [Armatimonadota bacterium]
MSLIPCVIDASVLIKLFLKEEHTVDVQYLIHTYLADNEASVLSVPDLVYVECANIFWKEVRKKVYTMMAARHALVHLRLLALPTTSTGELMERALDIASVYDITAYDASYVALAERLQVLLLTSDVKLARTMKGSPYQVVLIQDYLNAIST